MLVIERLRCVSGIGLLAVALAAGVAITAVAKSPPAGAAMSALPEPLTKESARELVSRLSDEEVRTLLLDQLDFVTTGQPVPEVS